MRESEMKTSQLDSVSGNSESGIFSVYFVSLWIFLVLCVWKSEKNIMNPER